MTRVRTRAALAVLTAGGMAMLLARAPITHAQTPTATPTPAATGTAAPAGLTMQIGLVGDTTSDPPGGAGGATRDLVLPNSLVVNPGDRVNFNNRSGGMHQVALFGPNLTLNGTTAATNLEDLAISHRNAPAWGNFVVPPDGAAPTADDPATDIDERRVRDGLLSLGPSPVGVSTADRQAGRIDSSYVFTTPGSYMVICNFRPHVLGYGQAGFIIVRGTVPAPAAAAGAPAAPASQTTTGAAAAAVAPAAPAAPKTGGAGLVGGASDSTVAFALLAMAAIVMLGGRAVTGRLRAR